MADFLEGDDSGFCTFLLNVRELLLEGAGSVEFEEGLSVDVSAAPLEVHESNNIIEDGLYLLLLTNSLFYDLYGFEYKFFRHLLAAHKG